MLGIIVGRFQVSQLHEGHIALLSAVSRECSRVVVFVGCTEAVLNAHDPLPFFCRADAIRNVFPQVHIEALDDHPSDIEWSLEVDRKIGRLRRQYLATDEPAVIYGGRDSCLSHYSGMYPTKALDLSVAVSGTAVRSATELGYSYEFRTGMIYAAQCRFPTSFQTVDIAIFKDSHVLLGRKPMDGGLWRFPGGFVDPADLTLEAAARRELKEECGDLEVPTLRYLGSTRIRDWRYRSSVDAIMTSFFTGRLAWGAIAAGDDLAEAQWRPVADIFTDVHPVHQPLVTLLQSAGVPESKRVEV